MVAAMMTSCSKFCLLLTILASLALTVVPVAIAQTAIKPISPPKEMYAAKRANVRSGPGTNFRKVGLLERGQKVLVTSKRGNWFKLEATPEQVARFVYAPLLAETRPSGTTNAVRSRDRRDRRRTASRPPSQETVDRVSEAIWLIYGDVGRYIGTAFAIGSNEFITNAHVIKGLLDRGVEYIYLYREGAKIIVVDSIEALSMTYDIAYLKTIQSIDHPLNLVRDDFDATKEGQLWMIGYPAGDLSVFHTVKPIYSEQEYPLELVFNRKARGGSSGAPAMTADGDVVGVHIMYYGKNGYMLRVKYVRKLIRGDIGVQCQRLTYEECVDKAETKTWKMSANNEYAQFQIGYGGGMITLQNDEELLVRSAEAGFILAQKELCAAYYYGDNGFYVNKAKSRRWCREAKKYGR